MFLKKYVSWLSFFSPLKKNHLQCFHISNRQKYEIFEYMCWIYKYGYSSLFFYSVSFLWNTYMKCIFNYFNKYEWISTIVYYIRTVSKIYDLNDKEENVMTKYFE